MTRLTEPPPRQPVSCGREHQHEGAAHPLADPDPGNPRHLVWEFRVDAGRSRKHVADPLADPEGCGEESSQGEVHLRVGLPTPEKKEAAASEERAERDGLRVVKLRVRRPPRVEEVCVVPVGQIPAHSRAGRNGREDPAAGVACCHRAPNSEKCDPDRSRASAVLRSTLNRGHVLVALASRAGQGEPGYLPGRVRNARPLASRCKSRTGPAERLVVTARHVCSTAPFTTGGSCPSSPGPRPRRAASRGPSGPRSPRRPRA